MRDKDCSLDDSMDDLLVSIRREFPHRPLLSKGVVLAYAPGDVWSVQRIIDVLDYRPWDEVSYEEFLDCGPDELKSYLSPQAFLYYLPGLLTTVLQAARTRPRTRLNVVVTLMVLPVTSDHILNRAIVSISHVF